MATTITPAAEVTNVLQTSEWSRHWQPAIRALHAVASLRLTVLLFALSIFLILVGTLAQVEMDIWAVIATYFRTWIAWVPVRILLPRTWFSFSASLPDALGFWFPGGKMIGAALAANLLAAHLIRFRVQARGGRLWAGLATFAVGVLLTWTVIRAGHNPEGIQGAPPFAWEQLWQLLKWSLLAIGIGLSAWWYTMARERKIERRVLAGGTLAIFALVVTMFSFGSETPLSGPSLRVLWQLIQGGAAGLVLLAGCAVLFGRRGGVVLLHLGIGLLMGYEFFVATYAEESQMQIAENQTVNFTRDIRSVELAVIDRSDPNEDRVVVIPAERLKVGRRIQDEKLPFDVEVVEYHANAGLRPIEAGEKTPASAGIGLRAAIVPRRAGTGTDSGGEVDEAAAYVRFYPKGDDRPLGTYLLSQIRAFDEIPETVEVNGVAYDTFLRFKRNYKDYQITLLDVRKDDYIGTNTPMNYSSDVHLVDKSTGTDRKAHIWMNNPLRYAGETFYQSNYHRTPDGTEITVLQVVTNTGWMVPYVACMIVGIGMGYQFLLVLMRYLRRRSDGVVAVVDKSTIVAGNPRLSWGITLFVLAIAAAMVLGRSRPGEIVVQGSRLDLAGRIPVVYEGRVKPLDTVARTSLRIISDRDFYEDPQRDGEDANRSLIDRIFSRRKNRQPAIRWLIDVISGSDAAFYHRVFRITNLDVLDTLKLERRKGFRYALDEFIDQIDSPNGEQTEFRRQVEDAIRLRQDNPEKLSLYQRKLLDLDRRLRVFLVLRRAFQPWPFPSMPTAEEFAKDPDAFRERVMQIRDQFPAMQRDESQLMAMQPPLVVANPEAEEEHQQWLPFAVAANRAYIQRILGEEPLEGTLAWATILDAYRRGDAKTFNTQLNSYLASLQSDPPPGVQPKKTQFEFAFNRSQPFMQAMVLYIFAFVLGLLGWLVWPPLQRTSFWVILLAFLMHTFALGARIYISGRPPVTNLYSAAVFIGWGCVILGMLLELQYRLGLGNILAATIGYATLLVAHFLAGSGDTFTVLVAVLDTQFWLATHVVCVTLGYSTTYAAGLLGVLYVVLRGMRYAKGRLPARMEKGEAELPRMIYGVTCFAIFFSFVGTVLGGLWADDSWGRFWGWDPKENGALIIVLWNALILHARWGGLVRGPGLALLAVAGNITTSWSMFGVNELGIGLHSYGFTEGVLRNLALFVMSQLVIITAGLVIERLLRGSGDGKVRLA